MNKRYVTASELGEFVYCKRAWWLRFNGLTTKPSPNMIAGTAKHEQLVTHLETHRQKSIAAYVIVGIGAVLLMASLFFWILFR
ncbi:MAG: hypothetical protein ACR2IV_17580 [Bryobacteraceae bacterium]